jgi:hypothetical protein
MMIFHGVILVHGIFIHFPNIDEIGHLPAGVSHWLYGKFDLYRVNPPLVRVVSGASPTTQRIEFNWMFYSDEPGLRPEFTIGLWHLKSQKLKVIHDFIYPRLCCLIFPFLGALVLVAWSNQVFGRVSAHVVCGFWCFCPNILAHGQTIIPDVGSVAMGILASYSCWKYVRSSSTINAANAGFYMGLALLTKLTWLTALISLPLSAALGVVFLRGRWKSRLLRNRITDLCVFYFVSLFVLNAGYLFEGSFRALGDYRFCSEALGGDGADTFNPKNRFQGSVLARVPVPVPRNYVQGIDYLRFEIERKAWSFLLGEWRDGSWWYYYIVTTFVKTPLTTLIAASIGLYLLIRYGNADAKLMALLLGFPALIAFVSVSQQGGFNHHHRYVLAIYAPMFMFAAALCQRELFHSFPTKLGIFLCAISIVSGLAVWPHFLGYFNASVGGPAQGWKILGFSNVDWGQDILEVDKWLKANSDKRPLVMDLYNLGIDEKLFDVPITDPPQLPKGASIDEVRRSITETQWWIISVKKLYNLPDQEGLEYLQQIQPVERIAYAYHVYRIDPLPADP